MSDLPTPITRKEQFLNSIARGNTSDLPTPITREEEYLDAIAKSGGGSGDGDMKKSVYDSDLAVANAGGIGAFVGDAISGKVDKVEGKGLSTNDYSDTEKGKVADNTSAIGAIVNEYGAKNLCPIKDIGGTQAGLTVTMNGDGSITFHAGTSTNTSNAFIYLQDVRLKAGQYYYSGGLPTSFNDKIALLNHNYSSINKSDFLFTADGTSNYGMIILIYPQITLSQDVTFYPMIRDARITDSTYVPYAMTNRELTERTERSIEYSGDINDLLKPGFYITATGVTNTPNDSDNHFINNGLFVSGNGINYCSQMIIDTRTQLYVRICNNGTWSSWAAYTKA